MSDTGNVIHLPRPEGARGPAEEMGLFIRVGRNDHLTMLDLLAEGERRLFGLVVDAQYSRRHRDLKTEARKRNVDVILDPKTQAMATLGGYTHSLAELPWATARPHRIEDFSGAECAAQAERIVAFAVEHGYTQILGPTHFLQRHNDPWLPIDIALMEAVKRAIEQEGAEIDLIYPLALPIGVLREPAYRRALLAALRDAPSGMLWLKVDSFGKDASGQKTVAYIEACRELHQLGVPLVADHVGGLPGLGLLAFGAVGGISHGITMYEGFSSYSWRTPQPNHGGRIPPVRVYIPRLGMHMKKDDAAVLLNASTRIKGRFGCTDTHCCNGVKGQFDRPARHFLVQRGREVTELSGFPESVRASSYLDRFVRPVSDDVAALAGSESLPDRMRTTLQKRQTALSKYRKSVANLAEAERLASVAKMPERLENRRTNKSS